MSLNPLAVYVSLLGFEYQTQVNDYLQPSPLNTCSIIHDRVDDSNIHRDTQVCDTYLYFYDDWWILSHISPLAQYTSNNE